MVAGGGWRDVQRWTAGPRAQQGNVMDGAGSQKSAGTSREEALASIKLGSSNPRVGVWNLCLCPASLSAGQAPTESMEL